ncbi:kinase-like domain-containing protein, partial [Baffinella frigidus]
MKVDEVKQQLEEMKEERFLLVGRLDDLCAMQMEMKLKLEVMHPGASKEQMDAALAHLARLDASNASNASNVADVSAAVEAQLGAHAGKYKQLVQDGLDKSCAKMKRLEKVLLENAGNNASIITEKLDRQGGSLAEMHQMLFSWRMEQKQAREKEREDTEKVKSGVQSSAGRFWERFEYAPFPTEEGDIQIGVDEQSELGEGSFATTYRMSAVNGATPGVEKGQLFAVKKILKAKLRKHFKTSGGGSSSNQEATEKGKAEVKAIDGLRHLNIIKFIHLMDTEEAFFIVMEFAEGGTLASKVHKDLSSSDTRKWALQLVKVLVYMHEQGVSHRDLKPENVLLSAAGDIKVADFGLAGQASTTMASVVGTKVGTARYFSPELGKDSKGTPPANDVWALGCIFLEMVLRERLKGALWPDDSEVEAKRLALLQRALVADPWLGAAIPQMLDMDHHARFSAAHVLRVLESPARHPAKKAEEGKKLPTAAAGAPGAGTPSGVRESLLAGRGRSMMEEVEKTPLSPSEPRTPSGVSSPSSASNIKNEEARTFWMVCFLGADQVEWTIFAAALKDQFPFMEDAASLSKINESLDINGDGNVTVLEFNVFTRMLGLEGACRKKVGQQRDKREAQEQTVQAGRDPPLEVG